METHGNIDHKGGQNQVRGEVNDVFLKDMPQKDKKNKNKKTTVSAGNGAKGKEYANTTDELLN